MAGTEIDPVLILRGIIEDIADRRRMGAGITACLARKQDFDSQLEMKLAGIAMVPEARDLVTERLGEYWDTRRLGVSRDDREWVIGAGLHAAIYCAARVRMGYPRPVVLEQNGAGKVGGAFAVSMKPVFRLNSRSRPGNVGLPDQDKALNDLPGGLIQPSMISSEEYPDNADMAWLIRLALAQFADVYPDVTAASAAQESKRSSDGRPKVRLTTTEGTFSCARVIDARGMGDPVAMPSASQAILNFTQFMERMGGMFPLRDMGQVAVLGGGDSAKCAVESLLGVAPGNTSAIGLDYVNRVDWYVGPNGIGPTCSEFREQQRGRYIRIAQFLAGNESQPADRLRLISGRGYITPLPDGALVNDRTYDTVIMCTGSKLAKLDDPGYAYYPVRADPDRSASTVLAKMAEPIQIYQIGPAAGIEFSDAEVNAGITENKANLVAMFRLAQRTAALGAMLPDVSS
jgi:hypothetical protein